MAHNLHITDQGRVSFAFVGARANIWHRLGNELQSDATRDEWLKAAGLDFDVLRVPCLASLEGNAFDHITGQRFRAIENRSVLVRHDNGMPLGIVSENRYNVVQPSESLDFCFRYVGVDDRFNMSAAGALGNGETIWATASFKALEVAGEAHQAHLLFKTTFDATSPTIVQMTITRAVCENTIAVATADKRAVVKVKHSRQFNAGSVAKELAELASSVETYKQIGDALAQNEMAKEEISGFFKQLLDIPFEAKKEDISTRKMNQFGDLSAAYLQSVREGAPAYSAWSALQAVTRYVDHDRGGTRAADAQFESAMFGSGADLKAEAMGLLMPRIRDRVLIPA